MSWGAPGPVGGEAVVASAPVMAEGLGAVLVLGVLLEALGVALVVVCQLLYFRDCITVSLAEIFDRHSREVFTQHFPLSSLHRSIHFRLHKSYRFVVNFFQDGTTWCTVKF